MSGDTFVVRSACIFLSATDLIWYYLFQMCVMLATTETQTPRVRVCPVPSTRSRRLGAKHRVTTVTVASSPWLSHHNGQLTASVSLVLIYAKIYCCNTHNIHSCTMFNTENGLISIIILTVQKWLVGYLFLAHLSTKCLGWAIVTGLCPSSVVVRRPSCVVRRP